MKPGPTARILYGPVQFSASLALTTLASVFAVTPWRMVEAELYTHSQSPAAKLGTGRSASARAEFLRLTREAVRAWCARPSPRASDLVCAVGLSPGEGVSRKRAVPI